MALPIDERLRLARVNLAALRMSTRYATSAPQVKERVERCWSESLALERDDAAAATVWCDKVDKLLDLFALLL